jgi:hypothetical protein
MYWTHNRISFERDMSRAAIHALEACRSQSLQLRAAFQVAQDHPPPMETHYANGFSNYMWAIQQAPSALSNTGGGSRQHPTRQEQQSEHKSKQHPTRQGHESDHKLPTEVKTEQESEHKLPTEVKTEPNETVRNHHGTKRTPSVCSSSQSGRGNHKKQKHKRPQVPRRFVLDPPKTYVDGKSATMTEDIGPSDLLDLDSSQYHRRRHRKGHHHHRRSRKHNRHGGSGGSGSGSSDAGSSSSSSGGLSHQSWDFDDFSDKDGIWKPPKGHPAWHRVKSHTRKIKTVKRPKRVTLLKWDGNPITFPDKMSEVRNALTDVGLGYLVDKTFLKYWTTYGNKNHPSWSTDLWHSNVHSSDIQYPNKVLCSATFPPADAPQLDDIATPTPYSFGS